MTVLDPDAAAVMERHARTFWLAARFLPAPLRRDVVLLYLVCRRLDDLVDGGDPAAAARLASVAGWAAGGPVAGEEERILLGLLERHPTLPLDAVVDFCEGQLSDLRPVQMATEAELDLYCYRVAGTVGRLMAALLGATAPDADGRARALGIALQRTNILRDVEEDANRKRVYLPRESLELAGGDRLLQLRIEIAIADRWYERGLAGIPLLPSGRRVVAAAAAMYREILREVERDLALHQQPAGRAVVPRSRKLAILAGSMLRSA